MLAMSQNSSLPEGLSVVICAYNAAGIIGKALEHLLAQERQSEFPWELILVDNASTDGTAAMALELWNSPVPLRIVEEKRQGIAYARQSGMRAAAYAYIGFVDQDNWVDPDWLENAWRLIHAFPQAGLIGAEGRAVFETPPPIWYARYERNYAVGPQLPQDGKIQDPERLIYTAGCVLRTRAAHAMLDAGFEPLLTSRAGSELLSGEDSEIQLIIRLMGWELHYNSALRFQHFMPTSRLSWDYHKRFRQGLGATSVLLEPYRRALRAQEAGEDPAVKPWMPAWRKAALAYLKDPLAIAAAGLKRFEGNHRVALSQAHLGEARKRWQLKAELERIQERLFAWLKNLPSREEEA